MRDFRVMSMGRFFLGLALVVMFFTAVPATADITPGWDYNNGLYTVEEVITFTFGGGVMLPSGGFDDSKGELGNWYGYYAGSNQGRNENKAYLEFELLPNNNAPYDFFIVTLVPASSSRSVFFDDLIASTTISTGSGDVSAVPGYENFYFTASLIDGDYIRLDFDYASVAGLAAAIASGAFEVKVEGASASIPEPATLAILGFGLAGLGLVRRRMK